MNCKRTEKLISLYIDGLLNEKDTIDLLNHISSCDDCRKLQRDMKKTVAYLNGTPKIDLPEGFETKMHFALKQEQEGKQKQKVTPKAEKEDKLQTKLTQKAEKEEKLQSKVTQKADEKSNKKLEATDETQKSEKRKLNFPKWTMVAMPATAAIFAVIIGVNYIFSGGLLKGEGVQDEAMSFSSMEESNAKLYDTETAEEEFGVSEDALVQKEEWLESRFVLELTFEGDDLKVIQKQAKNLMASFRFIENEYPKFIDPDERVEAHFTYVYYERVLKYAYDNPNVTLRELIKPEEEYDENSYFEVHFLFQITEE